jgi:hypothetical protein
MPPLFLKNHFDRLLVEEVYELNAISSTNPIANDLKAIPTTLNLAYPLRPRSRFQNRPKWERRLPERYIILSTLSSSLLKLNVSMQTLDTGEVVASPALLDCRATGIFVNGNLVKMNVTGWNPVTEEGLKLVMHQAEYDPVYRKQDYANAVTG